VADVAQEIRTAKLTRMKRKIVAPTPKPVLPSLPVPKDDSKLRIGICVALFVLTLGLFSRAIGHDFVNYDDPDYVTSNEHVQGGFGWAGLRWAATSGEASNWHPLTWVSHMIDWSLFGNSPRGHHATSVLLHALNAVLAFVAVRRLTGATIASAIFAALFAWHPLRVESVAWIAERKDVLSGLFFFVVLWSYAVYVERRRAVAPVGKPGLFFALALVAFAFGLMSKPMLVTLPCVLLLLDFWPLHRTSFPVAVAAAGTKTDSLGWLVLEKLPFFALAAASSWITYLVQKGGGSVSGALDLKARVANAIVSVVRYMEKFGWPFDLAVLYPHPGMWGLRKALACAAILFGITAVAVWQFRKRPWIAIGWFWFVGILVPVIGIVQVGQQAMADRYTYLPILGVQFALIWTVREFVTTSAQRQLWMGISALVLVAFSVRTWNQIGVWKNSFTLFDHAIGATKKNFVAHDNRGLFLFKAGKVEEAMADYRRALAINSKYLNPHNNLGYAYAHLGKPGLAAAAYREALALNPNHLEVRNNLANALSDLGQLNEAMEHYDFVLARQPNHANALNGSAVTLAMQNRLPEAKARFEQAIRAAPQNASAHNNLGNVCSMLGLRDDAIRHYRRAAELNPNEPHPLVLAGTLLIQQSKFDEAVEMFRKAIAKNPVNPEAHAQLGLALAQLGRRDDATRALRTALQQRPDYADAKAWLQAVEAAGK
jgi:protein O-mannosyl-transferase